MTQEPKWVIFRRVSPTATGYTRPLAAVRLGMPCRMLILLLIGVLLPRVHTSRVKRQFSPYHIQEWDFDQGSYREPHGYWDDAPSAYVQSFHSNYHQRHISPHNAPPEWNLNSQYWYSNPYSGNNVQQRSESGVPSAGRTEQGSSYGRPPIIKEQELIYTHGKDVVTVDVSKENPSGKGSGEFLGSAPTENEETTTQSSSFDSDSGIDVVPPPPPLDEEVEASGNDEKLGTEFARKDLPGAEQGFAKPGEEDFISSSSKKHSTSVPTSVEDQPTELSSTTVNPIDDKLKPSTDDRTTSDVITEIMGTTPSLPTERSFLPEVDAEGSTPLFVDADELPTWTPPPFTEITQNIVPQSHSGRTIIPFIEFIPTEVPAATIPAAQPSLESSEDNESSGLEVSKDPAILRSPPLPKEVSEKLSELGLTPVNLLTKQ
ncbi:hypothetical protein OESDEN_03664 [Oesophagostomum dentatum]|uniref:Uncharacterized protein n=1 Tax=Oesophagostomum dentatum TaxID=61180 RepID=A0A0B1TJT7_OESDE|nr:hypothetical protein OESDEN_03664 [Oesophagostomum dentatum]